MNENQTYQVTQWIVKSRLSIIVVTLLIAVLLSAGIQRLSFDNDYRAFFSKDNPQLAANDALENTYSGAINNVLIVLAPKTTDVFAREVLGAVQQLTKESWLIPLSMRVDSLTNYQHTYSVGDELLTVDLVEDVEQLSSDRIHEIKDIALHERSLVRRIISPSGHVTGIFITILMPKERKDELFKVAAAARSLVVKYRNTYPNIDFYLTGGVIMDEAFTEATIHDLQTLIPVMYIFLTCTMILLLRSVTGTMITLSIVALSAASAMGAAGWLGIRLTPVSVGAPTIIMTLAVADSIHILVSFYRELQLGLPKIEALHNSMQENVKPIFLTSLTTAIGFLSMNFSDSPPFQHLGNITAIGVAIAFLLSISFLPAVVSMLPAQQKIKSHVSTSYMDRLADFIVRRHWPLFWLMIIIVVLLSIFIPRITLDDQFVEYFDKSMEFRYETDFVMDNLTGMYTIEFDLSAGEDGAVAEPAYLKTVDQFAGWLREQPGVMQVITITDVLKRLNMNMHGNDLKQRRLPASRELSAQYLLLYEMGLPFGLDLTNQININRSATRLVAILENMSMVSLRELKFQSEQWLRTNAPESMWTEGTSPAVMFAFITERNIKSMLQGLGVAILLIMITLIIMLKSFNLGIISLVPNLAPAIMTFGVWGMFYGRVGLAVSIVAALSLGIVVDDTVHFLSKYLDARRNHGYCAEEAVKYAFCTVGKALITTSFVLVAGFFVLAQSVFQANAQAGIMISMTIIFALIVDFLLLPGLLIKLDSGK